jgi:division protein CdvB (Snf7/Vps24/ESCRT-III family)
MTSSLQPEDISVRLDDIDTRLEEVGDQLDLLRTIQDANRRETRGNSQTVARLERTVRELSDIARLHQEGLRIAQREAERSREVFQEEIRRIWEYLRDRNGGSSTPN